MIVISCRIMIAIRSRSKMELGRRLSSSTQKQMKRERTNTTTASPRGQPTLITPGTSSRRASVGTIVGNPFESQTSECRTAVTNNDLPLVERGQCFCSTCQTYNGTDNESLWELQQSSPTEKPPSSFPKPISFAKLKNISMMFSSSVSRKDAEHRSAQVSFENQSDNDSPTRHSLTVSNAQRKSVIHDSHPSATINASSTNARRLKKQYASRTSTLTSSFSDEYLEMICSRATDKQPNSTPMKNVIT